MATAQDIFAFRNRFAEFSGVPDADIAAGLNTAEVFVDADLWSAGDYALAKSFFAAHLVSLQQLQIANATIDGTGFSDLFVESIGFGERRVRFQQRKGFANIESAAGPGEEMFSLTTYGQMYLLLRSRNIMPIAVV